MSEWIYGVNPVREGLQGSRRRPLEVLVAKGQHSPRLQQVLAEAREAGVTVNEKDRPALDRLAGNRHHQGVMLKVEAYPFAHLDELLGAWRDSGGKAFFLVLDGITDPHNLGALIRSADAAGCQGVIVAKDRSCPVTAVVDKASAGALEHVLLCQVTNLARTLETLKREGLWVHGLAGEAEAVPFYQADLKTDLALVVGSEGSGLRPNVRKHCDLLLAIPMHGGISSLNASVAAGVALFEVVRQRS